MPLRPLAGILLAVLLFVPLYGNPGNQPESPSAADKALYLELQKEYGRDDGRYSLPEGSKQLSSKTPRRPGIC